MTEQGGQVCSEMSHPKRFFRDRRLKRSVTGFFKRTSELLCGCFGLRTKHRHDAFIHGNGKQ